MRTLLPVLALLLTSASPALAQAHGNHSPYAGSETREIESLSAEEIEGYLAGRGMELAIPAELNHYPGPRHVLDLAGELELSEEQAATAQRIFESMQERAIALGREFDRLFAEAVIDEVRLRSLTSEVARIQGELRFVHLQAHLATRDLLSAEQIRQYDEARGYGAGEGHEAGSHPGGHHR